MAGTLGKARLLVAGILVVAGALGKAGLLVAGLLVTRVLMVAGALGPATGKIRNKVQNVYERVQPTRLGAVKIHISGARRRGN